MGCEDVIDGNGTKWFPLDEGIQVQGLIAYFHGDGGDGWTNNWGFSQEILDWARERDYLVLGVVSPTGYDGSNDPAYGAAQPNHADAVATTIETFVQAYEPVEDTLYWGISGGSWHFASSFIAVAGARLPGIFVANCGGSGVSFGWAWNPETDLDTRDRIAVYFNYGSEDFLAERANDSYEEYLDRGFVADQLVHPGAGHCDHPLAGPTIDFWERHRD